MNDLDQFRAAWMKRISAFFLAVLCALCLVSLTSTGVARAQSSSTFSVAVDVLNADEHFQSVSTDAAITGAIAGERPLASLPGRDDMPEGFQFLDKDDVVAE